MRKLYTFLTVFAFAFSSKAQSDDILLVKKYLPDSLHFQTFPQSFLLDSIIPGIGYREWELNTIQFRGQYQNRYRSNHRNDLPDSIVLTKAKAGFYTFCPPGGCGWYLSAHLGRTIVSVETLAEMEKFIGTIDNKFDAYLWLVSHDLANSRFVPVQTGPAMEYKQVDGGYLLRFELRISDCPKTHGRRTYFVGADKKVVLIKTTITNIGEGCI